MPSKPKRLCMYPGCRAFTEKGSRCLHHKRQEQREYDRDPNKHSLYNSRQWRAAREGHLRNSPLCVTCKKEGRTTPATEVDHIIPHGGDRDKFWQSDNWQSMCKSCHSVKTRRERK